MSVSPNGTTKVSMYYYVSVFRINPLAETVQREVQSKDESSEGGEEAEFG